MLIPASRARKPEAQLTAAATASAASGASRCAVAAKRHGLTIERGEPLSSALSSSMTSDRRSCGQKPTYEDRVGEASRYATCALRAEIIGVGAFGRRLCADKLRGGKS